MVSMTTSTAPSKHDPAIDPLADCQIRLIRLWEKNLGVRVVSEDDYFEMGGDSLLGTQLLSWIQEEFGVELSLLDIFEFPKLAALARHMLAVQAGADIAGGKPTTDYLYFGPADARLFGALHRPAGSRGNAGVVLCYPIGQEYMRAHRTYVELARSLAATGRNVLRFDYFGCGDSAGETTAGNLERWQDDIRQAIEEMRSRTGVQLVYLVGARIGANLARDVGVGRSDVAGAVLWEPIVDGSDYIAALQRAHHSLLDSNAVLDGYAEREPPECFMELVGFPITKKLHDELAGIDLLREPASEAEPDTLLLVNSHKPTFDEYVMRRGTASSKLEYVTVNESDAIWLKSDDENKGVVPAQAIQAIASWLSRRTI
jgi:pimeloyl-ACP methyl ester carboxylesterase/acyl carrier protein